MSRRQALGQMAGAMVLAAAAGMVGGWLGLALVAATCALAGWALVRLVGPQGVEQRHLRIWWGAGAPADPAWTADALARLAQVGGRVTLYARRSGDDLALYLTVPAALEPSLQTLAARLWPGGVLEPVPALPTPPAARGLAIAGRIATLDLGVLLDPPGDGALWVHWQAGGSAILRTVGGGPLPAGWQRVWGGRAGWGRRYPWITPGFPVAVGWPAADSPLGAALRRVGERDLAPPPGYTLPSGAWPLGTCMSGPVVGLDRGGAAGGHALFLEPQPAIRLAWVAPLVQTVQQAGGTVVVIDAGLEIAAGLYQQATPQARQTLGRLVLGARGNGPTPGLLAAPGPSASPAEGLAALHQAVTTALPLYLRYLGYLGLTPDALGPAAPLVPAWVGITLLAHYRARVLGHVAEPLPEIPALLTAWDDPDRLDALIAAEAAAWTTPAGAWAAVLAAGSPAATAVTAMAAQVIAQAQRAVAGLPAMDRRLYTLGLRSRLAPAAAPILRGLWERAAAPDTLWLPGQAPYLVELPGIGQPTAAREMGGRYGLYLLHVLERWAALRSSDSAPALVIWAGLAPVWGLISPAAVARLTSRLAASGITIIGMDTGLAALPAAQAQTLSANCPTWLLGRIDDPTAALLAPALRVAGLPGRFSFAVLPPGEALARVPQGERAFLTLLTTQEPAAGPAGQRAA